jgi:hypothetical protein
VGEVAVADVAVLGDQDPVSFVGKGREHGIRSPIPESELRGMHCLVPAAMRWRANLGGS